VPNYIEYHKSLTDELHALKNRIRNLCEHWLTDGEYKEAALRTMLRRHLPNTFIVGRGFIVTARHSSPQIDLLIVDGNKPTLFRDGDLMFVTPDCVRAVIEVKTSLPSSTDVKDCAIKLSDVGKLCCENGGKPPWLGIFDYEGTLQNSNLLLDAVEVAFHHTEIAINCIAYGKDRFVRFWKQDEIELGDALDDLGIERWRVYRLNHIAPAYFIGNVVDALSTLSGKNNAFAWYPLSDGKRAYLEAERILPRR
jgi:hypothetical protein